MTLQECEIQLAEARRLRDRGLSILADSKRERTKWPRTAMRSAAFDLLLGAAREFVFLTDLGDERSECFAVVADLAIEVGRPVEALRFGDLPLPDHPRLIAIAGTTAEAEAVAVLNQRTVSRACLAAEPFRDRGGLGPGTTGRAAAIAGLRVGLDLASRIRWWQWSDDLLDPVGLVDEDEIELYRSMAFRAFAYLHASRNRGGER